MKIARGTLLVIALVAAAALELGACARTSPQRRRAQQLYQQAEQAGLAGRADEQLRLLLTGLVVDPTYLPLLAEIAGGGAVVAAGEKYKPVIEQAIAQIEDRAQAHCIQRVLYLQLENRRAKSSPRPQQGSPDCRRFYDLLNAPQDHGPVAFQFWRRYPESSALTYALHTTLLFTGQSQHALELGQIVVRAANPRVRLFGYLMMYHAARQLRLDNRLAQVDSVARADLGRFRYPIRYAYLRGTEQHAEISVDSIVAQPDWLGRLLIASDFGTASYENGQLAQSDRLWNVLLADYAELTWMQGRALQMRGRTHMKAGRLAQAEADLLAARGPTEMSGDSTLLVQIHHNLFHVYEGLGDRQRALASGYAYIESAGDSALVSARMMAHHDVGWYHWRFGEYERARPLLDRMLAIIDTLDSHWHFAGEYYERIGDLDRALYYYDLAARREHGDYRSVARRAVLAARMGDTTNALRLASLHDQAQGPRYPEFTPQLPGILADFGRLERAAVAAEAATAAARARGQAAAVATLLLERAGLEIRRGRAERAWLLADSAQISARAVAAFETEMLAAGVSALAHVIARGASVEPLRRLTDRAALAQLPQLNLQLLTLLARGYAAQGQLRPALGAYARSAALNDSLASSLGTDVDRARFRSARNDVTAEALRLIIARGDAQAYVEWSIRRKARGVSNGRDRTAPRPGRGEAIIDFVVLDSVVAALVITPARTAIQVLPVRADSLREQVARLRTALTPRVGPLLDLTRARFDAPLARMLYDQLIRPLDLAGADRLVLVADGALHYLPFEALLASSRSDDFLLRHFTTRYAPSLDLAHAPPAVVQGRAIFFSSTAVETGAELEAVVGATRNQSRILMNRIADAREEQVRQEVADAQIVHFAAHATTNDAAPAFAFLALRAAGDDDGRLHAFEIEKLRFNRALVVLSGCDTGGGRIAGGEGVLSLSRAFLRAGASATVATLWPVGNGTPEIMSTFYSQLSRGADPASALREAKLLALQGRYQSPLYWAAFVLIAA